jgi:hypothetical protein
MSKMRKKSKSKMRNKSKQPSGEKAATQVSSEAVSRLIEVIQDLINRGNLKKHDFEAAVLSAGLSYGAGRKSDKEYEQFINRIRATFEQK